MTRPGPTPQRPYRAARAGRGLLAALVGVLLVLAAVVVGAVPAAAGNRVGATTPVLINTVGHSAGISPGQRLGNTPPQPRIVVATGVAADTAADIPSVIYRGGGRSPSNLRLRPGEDALSFRDSLSNPLAPGRPVMNPGKDWIGIDTSKLPPGSVVPDGVPGSSVTPPGHVSVYVDDWELLKEAIIESGRFPK